MLNAKIHAREAEIVAKAGHQHPPVSGKGPLLGNVTIATNMAGRGTDIKLGPGVVYPKCIGDLGPGPGTPEQQSRRGWQESGVTGTKCCIHCPQYDPKTNCAHCFKPKIDARLPRRGPQDLPAAACRAGCTSSAPSATRPGASTTSCEAGRAARATPAPAGSSCRCGTN